MPTVVVFRLAAPIAAFGEIAVGERRGTWRRPSLSAVIGLTAAALGLPRDAPGHEALADGFLLAVRTEAPGRPMADFHTAQTPPQRRNIRYATRREELADDGALGTIVSRRDYLADAAFTILLWPTAGAPHAPDAVAAALNRPVFAPYAGRRSCPLGAPVAALPVEAGTVAAAFAAYDAETAAPRRLARELGLRFDGEGSEIAFDERLRDRAGLEVARIETRRDGLASRPRWQFAPRTECIARAQADAGAAA